MGTLSRTEQRAHTVQRTHARRTGPRRGTHAECVQLAVPWHSSTVVVGFPELCLAVAVGMPGQPGEQALWALLDPSTAVQVAHRREHGRACDDLRWQLHAEAEAAAIWAQAALECRALTSIGAARKMLFLADALHGCTAVCL